MSVLSDLQSLSSAEEFFTYLDVPHDPAVLDVARLHILRMVGDRLREERAREDEDDRDEAIRARYRAYLEQAYAALADKGPLERRLFKVHKDAVREKPAAAPSAFVPISSLVRARSEPE